LLTLAIVATLARLTDRGSWSTSVAGGSTSVAGEPQA
jgi:hypothetical protein